MNWRAPLSLRRYGILGMNARNIGYISRYNERRLYPLVDNKLKTKLLAAEHAIPTPDLRLVVRYQHQIRNIEQLLAGLQEFAIKPTKGAGGKGILIISGRKGKDFVKPSGAVLSLTDLKRHLSNILAGLYSLGGSPDIAIIEDLIEADDRFDRYSYQGVPDIRIVVFKGYPIMAMLRLATRASDGKANLHQGAVGVGLDIATGRCLNAVQHSRRLRVHPDTGASLASIEIPDWESLLRLAAGCYEMTGLGYLGADIVLDKRRGPQLLELNARPGLAIQLASGVGLLPRLRHIEALQAPHPTPEARVRYAMEAFRGQATDIRIHAPAREEVAETLSA